MRYTVARWALRWLLPLTARLKAWATPPPNPETTVREDVQAIAALLAVPLPHDTSTVRHLDGMEQQVAVQGLLLHLWLNPPLAHTVRAMLEQEAAQQQAMARRRRIRL